MIDVALTILALIGGGLTLELFAAAWPPLGYQSESGLTLHAGSCDAAEELQAGNPS
jgi:hypothetical protein